VLLSRSSGILLHLTSLPGGEGIGDLGAAAREFAEFLAASGQKVWQVLPVNPTGYGDSPYQGLSAFAGNPLLISLQVLCERGLLDAGELRAAPDFPADRVDFDAVIRYKLPLLRRAAGRFFASAGAAARTEYDAFCASRVHWLDDYARFMSLKQAHGGGAWTNWPPALRKRDPAAMARWGEQHQADIEVFQFWQFEFFRQWNALQTYCRNLGIRIMGDIPIYVAHDSVEVWAQPELFYLDDDGRATVVAGVPPDYFSASGQLWGNPIYRWDLMAVSEYAWWIERVRASLLLFDLVRIDHFRGFEAYWEIPAGAATAATGRWVKGPGAQLFDALRKQLGELPIVAENLGVITPEVEALRTQFGFPGMSVLQFAFGTDPQAPSFRPHNYPRDVVAYTGGHDNDTTLGWWTSVGSDSTRTPEDIRRERASARMYLAFADEPVHWVFMRTVAASVAVLAMIPLQDVLGLGSEARMNLPGTISGNWRWRVRAGALTTEIERRLKQLTLTYDR
jgi:4-alpha-glucanotransferase